MFACLEALARRAHRNRSSRRGMLGCYSFTGRVNSRHGVRHASAPAAAQMATCDDAGDGNDCLDEEEREFVAKEDEKARARLQAENGKGGEEFPPWALTGQAPKVSMKMSMHCFIMHLLRSVQV